MKIILEDGALIGSNVKIEGNVFTVDGIYTAPIEQVKEIMEGE